MRITSTAALTATFLGATVNYGWSPGPADLKTPLSAYKSQSAVAVGPPDGRKTYGHGKGFGPATGLQPKQFKSGGALTAGRTPSSSNRINLRVVPQAARPKQGTQAPTGGSSAMDRLQGM